MAVFSLDAPDTRGCMDANRLVQGCSMRGRTLRTPSGRRNRKRCLLAGLILASGPSLLAQEPVALAPLPLRPVAESRAAGVENPFCQPVVMSLSDSGFTRLVDDDAEEPLRRPLSQIELASGIEIRIEESGPTEPAKETTAQRHDPYPAPVKIIGRGGVRANPIAINVESDSTHRPPPALTKSSRPEPVALSFSDSGMLLVEIEPELEPAVAPPTELSLSDTEPSLSDVAMSLSDVVSESLTDDTMEPTVARPAMGGRVIAVPSDGEPLEERGNGGGTIRAAVKLQPFDLPQVDVDDARLVNGGRPRVDVGHPPLIVQRVPRILPAELVPQRLKSAASTITESSVNEREINQPEINQRGASEREIDDSQAIGSAVKGSAVVGVPASESQSVATEVVARSTPRSAQPTETARPPAELNRKSAEPAMAMAKAVATASGLKLRPREVRALKLGEAIRAVHSGDPRVATAISVGTDGLQVIATGDGATTLTIDLVDSSGETRRVGYRVEVGDVRSAPADSQPTLVETLTETVRNAFPEARVVVRSEAGRLTVVGSCPDDSTARQVMRMVRSACRVAVDDKLVIR